MPIDSTNVTNHDTPYLSTMEAQKKPRSNNGHGEYTTTYELNISIIHNDDTNNDSNNISKGLSESNTHKISHVSGQVVGFSSSPVPFGAAVICAQFTAVVSNSDFYYNDSMLRCTRGA